MTNDYITSGHDVYDLLSDEQQELIDGMPEEHSCYLDPHTEELTFNTGHDIFVWYDYKSIIKEDTEVKKRENKSNKSNKENYYIDKQEMLLEILKSKQAGELTPKAVDMFLLLAERVMKRLQWRYRSQEDFEDCKQTGLYHLFKSWDKFDPRKSSNPFAYYTEIFKKGTADGYNKLHKKSGDKDNEISVMSYTSSNEGNGMFNIN